MQTLTPVRKTPFLDREILPGLTPARLAVAGIVLLSLALHLINLQAIGDANTYYTAAVESMLDSWNNFFFAAAEPGGSVSVDKPPLGLWIEAAFACVLGVQGWTVSLPNILAGVLSVPLLYSLVRRHAGALAGILAALVLAVTPVVIATDRNNTMDGMLVFTLLLAAWAFVAATETGRTRWLFVGAALVGLGFNIKMLQAFLPLPAFYALYLLGARRGWARKAVDLLLATALLVVVSLSWAVIVDLTPADRRPYVGSSEDNTVMELIVGHNGLSRLFNPRGGGGQPAQGASAPGAGAYDANPTAQDRTPAQPAPPAALEACAGLPQGEACSFTQPNGNAIVGRCVLPPAASQLACAPLGRLPAQAGGTGAGSALPGAGARPGSGPPPGVLGDGPNASPDLNPAGPGAGGNTPFSQETGSPGVARFFVYPLSKQMSWVLPFALLAVALAAFAARPRLPLEPAHKALVLWGGWLLTCLVFFSAVEGIFHAYYVIMLAPALGALVGTGAALLWRWGAARRWADLVLVLAAALTVAFQIYTAAQYGFQSILAYLPLPALALALGLLLFRSLRPAVYLAALSAMLFLPLLWTGMTVLDAAPNTNLPTSIGAGGAGQARQRPAPGLNETNRADDALVDFLQANTQEVEYLVAVPNAHSGSPLVLATGRPVLYMGGFSGSDAVIDAAGLAGMVANGELRYVLYGGNQGKQEIARWLETSCTVVPEFSRADRPSGRPSGPGAGAAETLYECR